MTTYSASQLQGAPAGQSAGPVQIPEAPRDLTPLPPSPNCVSAADKAMARNETLGSELGLS